MNANLQTTRARLEEIVTMIRDYRAAKDVAKWIVEYAGQIKEILDGNHNGNLGQIDVLIERELALRQAEHTLAATAHILEPIRDAEFEMVQGRTRKQVEKSMMWHNLPDWTFAICADPDGTWYAVDRSPTFDAKGWIVSHAGEAKFEKIIGPIVWDNFHWQHSLIKRP